MSRAVLNSVQIQEADDTSCDLRGLASFPAPHREVIITRYKRLLPVLRPLVGVRAIYSRNRTWPGTSPGEPGVTDLLSAKNAGKLRAHIRAYAAKYVEDADELWLLLRAYCRYGPIGLIDALLTSLPPLIPEEIEECAAFHRLAKHPRTDAGIYICEKLTTYAEALGLPTLHPFIARYAWATDKRIAQWYVGESRETDFLTKTTRRLNRDLPYPHQQWRVSMVPIGLPCVRSAQDQRVVIPWLIWMCDTLTGVLMGFHVCPTQPTIQDLWLTLRWSIWHYGAPWWKARGAPDELCVPASLGPISVDAEDALRYLHTRLIYQKSAEGDDLATLPQPIVRWLASHIQSATTPYVRRQTIAELRTQLLDVLSEEVMVANFAQATPSMYAERECSLPWSTGIAAALLLPSAGQHVVTDRRVLLWGVPFDLSASAIDDGHFVELRYDPDDARQIFAIYKGAHVSIAPACAFEHKTDWFTLRSGFNG